MLPARATIGLELALFLGLASPLLAEWFETTSASSRLSYALLVPALALVLALRAGRGREHEGERPAPRWAALFAALAALAFLGGSLSGVFTLSLCAVPLAVAAFVARWRGAVALRRQAPALGSGLACIGGLSRERV